MKMISATLLSVFLGALIFQFAKCCFKYIRIIWITKDIPGPKNDGFLIGNLKHMMDQTPVSIFVAFRSLAKEFSSPYRLRFLHEAFINIFSPEDCEIFMSTIKHSSKSEVYDLLKNWLKEGLLVSNGNKWVERRKLLTQAFHFNILRDFLLVFNEQTEKISDIIRSRCSEPIDITDLVTEFTLYSICETSMGCKLNIQDEETKKYVEAIHEIGYIAHHRILRPWLYSPLIYFFTPTYRREIKCLKILHEFTRKVIDDRMKVFESVIDQYRTKNEDEDGIHIGKKKRRLAMLDVLLQAQKEDNSIDYEGICEEVDTFMFEGHDTTATAINFSLMLIANHPEVQDKILQEINSVMQGRSSKPSYEDLKNMDYLERCVKESLRLYPSVYVISRVSDEDTVLNSGYVVPKDAKVIIHIYDVTRNPKVFPCPDKFDPDRFSPENIQNRHPYAYIPFSAGPRNCIGQRYALLEIKAFLTGILRKFVLTPIDTPESIVVGQNLVLRPQNGIRIKFTLRE